MKLRLPLALLFSASIFVVLTVACNPAPTPMSLPTSTAILTIPGTMPSITPSPTLAPSIGAVATFAPATRTPAAIPIDVLTAELSATVAARVVPNPKPRLTYGVNAFALRSAGSQLWVVHSTDYSEGDLKHFVAIYGHDAAGWQELSRYNLLNEQVMGSVVQVPVEPKSIWLWVQAFAGAHSGCTDLLRFDGKILRSEASNCSSTPGVDRVQDLNGDGVLDVVHDRSNYYVFCYACNVHIAEFDVWRWDGARMVQMKLTPLPASAPADLRRLANEAVRLAEAGLWKAASTHIKTPILAGSKDPIVLWNSALIRLIADARAEHVRDSGYPILANVFYGDYDTAINLMRPYSPDQIFSSESPLLKDTNETDRRAITEQTLTCTDKALQIQPNLASIYFLRGWAAFLANPRDSRVRQDIVRAAQLAPQDSLYLRSSTYFNR